jgi:hypothetical protein
MMARHYVRLPVDDVEEVLTDKTLEVRHLIHRQGLDSRRKHRWLLLLRRYMLVSSLVHTRILPQMIVATVSVKLTKIFFVVVPVVHDYVYIYSKHLW